MNIYRTIDAEINRVSEGLRVIEDIVRFSFENKLLSESARDLRHKIRTSVIPFNKQFLSSRNTAKDPGVKISQETRIDNKNNINDLLMANFKRVQEGLRSLEEFIKVAGHYNLSKNFESFRFAAYNLEQICNIQFQKTKRKLSWNKDLYCLTGNKFSKGRSIEEVVKAMIAGGAKIIQYREKNISLKQMYEDCLLIRELTKKSDVMFIVNDEITIAQMVNADGIHLGQDDLPLPEVRKIVGEEMILGLSTHSPEQAIEAVELGADYIGVGPIYTTQTKENVCDAVGYEYLEWVVENIDLPFVAIGGIKVHNLDNILQRNAQCVAMVTEIIEADNIKKTVKKIIEKLTNIK